MPDRLRERTSEDMPRSNAQEKCRSACQKDPKKNEVKFRHFVKFSNSTSETIRSNSATLQSNSETPNSHSETFLQQLYFRNYSNSETSIQKLPEFRNSNSETLFVECRNCIYRIQKLQFSNSICRIQKLQMSNSETLSSEFRNQTNSATLSV